MDYEGQICKPPMEIGRFMLPVAVGCSYNACRFCTLFKHLKFRELPLDKVEAELLRVKNLGGSPKKIFLGDGNPFGLSAERLLDPQIFPRLLRREHGRDRDERLGEERRRAARAAR